MNDAAPSAAEAIGAALDNPVALPRLVEPGDPGPDFERGKQERPPFPPGSPVKPLGIRSGMDGEITCFYLDSLGQLVGLGANNKHGKNSMIALYGPASWWLEEQFPQWSAPQYEGRGNNRKMVKASEIVGFDQAEASRALIEECVRRGIFDPAGRMRGRGAHALEGGRLAVHYGDKVLAPRWHADGRAGKWEWHEPGLLEGCVYPAGEPIPRPAAASVPPRSALRITQLLQTWNWKRGVLDVRLALGWLAAAPFGGALNWRPAVWITGPAGTGKSTLNGKDALFHQLLGRGVFRTGEASAAAIRQSLKNSTIPVMFDEIEADANNARVLEVVKLARLAASGDSAHRGGQDHNAHEFTIQSCFQFSSINIPPLEPQDRSRLAILELRPFKPGQAMPDMSGDNFPELGKELQRRMIDGWPRLAETKARFHLALAASGHSARACDQFGTLLACADLAMNDELPDDEEIDFWVSQCRPDRLAEVSEATADEMSCLQRLLTKQVQARGNEDKEPIGSWIGRAVNAAVTPLLADQGDSVEKFAGRLQQYGLKLVNPVRYPAEDSRPGRWGANAKDLDTKQPLFVAIAGDHDALHEIFQGTKWHKIHKAVLGRLGQTIDGIKMKFGYSQARAVLVPLYHVLDDDDLPAASQVKAVEAWLAEHGEGAEA